MKYGLKLLTGIEKMNLFSIFSKYVYFYNMSGVIWQI
jgi:hypothetical protein